MDESTSYLGLRVAQEVRGQWSVLQPHCKTFPGRPDSQIARECCQEDLILKLQGDVVKIIEIEPRLMPDLHRQTTFF